MTTRHLFPALFFAAALAASSLAATVPEYKLGDVAKDDVITPIPLVVPHPDATEALKQKLLQQSPSIVRFVSQASAEAETDLRNTVAKAREKFLTAMRAALQDRAPIESDLGTPAFTAALEFVSRDAPKNLPLETLAPIWVRAQSDQPFVDTLVKPLRDAMAQLVLTSGETESPLPNDPPVRLIAVKSFSEPIVIDSFEPNGQTVSSRKLISLRQAQRIVETQFPAGQERFGDFTSAFVRANCRYDAGLTDIVRAKRSTGFAVNDTFEAAQVIVHKGQTIDRRALSALAVLREKSLIGTLQTKLEQEQSVAGQIKSQTKWIAASLLLILFVLLLIYVRLRNRGVAPTATLFTGPALEGGAAQGALPPGTEAASWQARALLAEGKVERTHAAIRSGVLGWMKEKVFSTLFSQRQELLTANERATSEINDLEQRLEQLHAPLQERIQAYEQRIQELEQELVARKMPKPVPPTPLSLRRAKPERPETVSSSPSREAEAALAERERNVGEAEVRMAERARDLAEMDALLRARERLIAAAQGLPPNKNRIVIGPPQRGQQSDVVKDPAQAGLN